jgi:hypothetical protein
MAAIQLASTVSIKVTRLLRLSGYMKVCKGLVVTYKPNLLRNIKLKLLILAEEPEVTLVPEQYEEEPLLKKKTALWLISTWTFYLHF